MMQNPCHLHMAAIGAVRGSRGGQFEVDPTVLTDYTGPLECPPEEECDGTCDLARKYRLGFDAVRHNEDPPAGDSPDEVWRNLVTLVRGSP
jgi:hypothetical protein